MLEIRKVRADRKEREILLSIDKRCYGRVGRRIDFNQETLDTFIKKKGTIWLVTHQKVLACRDCKKKFNVGKKINVGYMLTSIYGKECYLISIAILKSYRDQGIGKKLFSIYLRQGRGYDKLGLHAVNPAMIHMAEKHGFKKIQTTKNYYGKQDCILMERYK